jgi:uncharacterized protein YgiB involved in biofilm formation
MTLVTSKYRSSDMGIENTSRSVESIKRPAASANQSLLEEAWSIGTNIAHKITEDVEKGAHWVEEHKVASVVAGAAITGATVALNVASKGKAAEVEKIATDELSATRSLGIGSDLGTETAGLLAKKSTLRSAIGVGAAILPLGLLAGCGNDVNNVAIYKDADECTRSGSFSKDACEEGYAASKNIYEKTAPKFNSKKECEDQTGDACTAPQSGQQYAFPAMEGYMMNLGNNSKNDRTTNSKDEAACPVYRSVSGDLLTSHGVAFGVKTTNTTAELEQRDIEEEALSTKSGRANSLSASDQDSPAFTRAVSSSSGDGDSDIVRGGYGGGEDDALSIGE